MQTSIQSVDERDNFQLLKWGGYYPSLCFQLPPRAQAWSDTRSQNGSAPSGTGSIGEGSAARWSGDASINPQPQLCGAVLCTGSPAHPAWCRPGKERAACKLLQQPGLLLICLSDLCWNIKKVMLCLDYRFCRNQISGQCHGFSSWIASFERRSRA